MSIKVLLQASRPHTYPLSLSGIVVGNALAYQQLQTFNYQHWLIFISSLWVALGLQILSNLANDYGDGIKGTDAHRFDRQTAQKQITPKTFKKMIIAWSIFIFGCGVGLLWISLHTWSDFIIFLALGVLAIMAAIYYTMGKNPYGYQAKGELAVFLFFGLLNVCGSLYLQTQTIRFSDFLIAISIGLLCTCVLMINNLRDIVEDKKNYKITLAVIWGKHKTVKIYHILYGIAIIIPTLQGISQQNILLLILPLSLIYLSIQHLKQLQYYAKQQINAQQLAPQLKKIVQITLITSMIYSLSQIFY